MDGRLYGLLSDAMPNPEGSYRGELVPAMRNPDGSVSPAVPGMLRDGLLGMAEWFDAGKAAGEGKNVGVSANAILSLPAMSGIAGAAMAPRGALASGAAKLGARNKDPHEIARAALKYAKEAYGIEPSRVSPSVNRYGGKSFYFDIPGGGFRVSDHPTNWDTANFSYSNATFDEVKSGIDKAISSYNKNVQFKNETADIASSLVSKIDFDNKTIRNRVQSIHNKKTKEAKEARKKLIQSELGLDDREMDILMSRSWDPELFKKFQRSEHISKVNDSDSSLFKLTDEEAANLSGAERLDIAQKNAALPVERGGLGLPVDNTPADRAKAMGFSDEDVFHGTDVDFRDLKPSKKGRMGPGVYVTENPDLANKFAGDRILPLRTRATRPARADEQSMDARQAARESDDFLQSLLSQGYDGVRIEDQFSIADPSMIRSRFAAFDPARKNSADLLAANPANAGLLGLPLLMNEDQRRKYGMLSK